MLTHLQSGAHKLAVPDISLVNFPLHTLYFLVLFAGCCNCEPALLLLLQGGMLLLLLLPPERLLPRNQHLQVTITNVTCLFVA
jgi:hypothetical protein